MLALALWLFNASNIDVNLQNHFFDFEQNSWLVDEHEPVKKFIFYNFPKVFLGAVIIFCGILAFKAKDTQRQKYVLILLGLILIPLIAGNIKKFTDVYCPKQLEIYDGKFPYVKTFQSYPENFVQEKSGQCFPAGHCVTGFAFFILFFALKQKRNRIFGLIFAFTFGWILGFYQMIKGAHFLGDTVISMLVCFLLAAIISKIYTARLQKIQN